MSVLGGVTFSARNTKDVAFFQPGLIRRERDRERERDGELGAHILAVRLALSFIVKHADWCVLAWSSATLMHSSTLSTSPGTHDQRCQIQICLNLT